jgi:hypothetical protein
VTGEEDQGCPSARDEGEHFVGHTVTGVSTSFSLQLAAAATSPTSQTIQ